MNKDRVFQKDISKAKDFKFGPKVANVFDDMVNRSVPLDRAVASFIVPTLQRGNAAPDALAS